MYGKDRGLSSGVITNKGKDYETDKTNTSKHGIRRFNPLVCCGILGLILRPFMVRVDIGIHDVGKGRQRGLKLGLKGVTLLDLQRII